MSIGTSLQVYGFQQVRPGDRPHFELPPRSTCTAITSRSSAFSCALGEWRMTAGTTWVRWRRNS
jgi:hypothetical protein